MSKIIGFNRREVIMDNTGKRLNYGFQEWLEDVLDVRGYKELRQIFATLELLKNTMDRGCKYKHMVKLINNMYMVPLGILATIEDEAAKQDEQSKVE